MAIRRLAGALLTAGLTILNMPASARDALSAPWHGEWRMTRSSLFPDAAGALRWRIERDASGSWLNIGERRCALRYDGRRHVRELVAEVDERRAWQLEPAHWPPGTDPAQLLGLRGEFARAMAILAGVPPGMYRKVAVLVPCAGHEGAVFLLHGGQTMVRVLLAPDVLGADISEFERDKGLP